MPNPRTESIDNYRRIVGRLLKSINDVKSAHKDQDWLSFPDSFVETDFVNNSDISVADLVACRTALQALDSAASGSDNSVYKALRKVGKSP